MKIRLTFLLATGYMILGLSAAPAPRTATVITNSLRLLPPTGARPASARPSPTQTSPIQSPAVRTVTPPFQSAKPVESPFTDGLESMAPISAAGNSRTVTNTLKTVVVPAPTVQVIPIPTVASTNMGNPQVIGRMPESNVLSIVRPQDERVLPAGLIKFQNTPLEQVLEVYSELTSRTVLKAPTVQAATQITLISATDLTLTEAIQAIDIILAQNNISIIPVGDKFLLVVPSTQALQEAAAFTKADAEDLPEASQYITKIVQLKYVMPQDVLPVIQPFAKIPGGIMAIDSSQVLIIRDYAVNIKRMLELIDKIDISLPNNQIFEVIPIKYALVEEVSAVLGGFTSGGSGSASSSASGAGRRRVSSSTSNSNTSQNRSLPGQPNTQNRLTSQQRTPTTTSRVSTPGTQSSAFQQRLSQIVSAAAKGGADAPLLGDARIIPFERNNSLLVLATREEMVMVRDLVEKLDVVQPQVLIEAIILEVSLSDNLSFGVSAAQNPMSQGGRTTFGGIRNSPAFSSSFTNALPGALPSGLSYYALLNNRWDIALQAIEGDSSINVLSRPRIQTSHAEQAELFVGSTRPYITGTSFGFNGQPISQYSQQSIGITLTVLPLINPDGLVVLDIAQTIESLGENVQIDGNDVPTTTRRNASAKVAVHDRETIMLGGFISNIKNKTESGVPILRKIPLIGKLFSSESLVNQRVELIVLMRPTVLATPQIASATALDEKNNLPGVRVAEREFEVEHQKRLRRAMLQEMKMSLENAKIDPNKPAWKPPIDLFEILESNR